MQEQVNLKKLFVVVDPNDEKAIALERAMVFFEHVEVDKDNFEMFIFIGVDGEAVNTRANNDNLIRDGEWFKSVILEPLEKAGIKFQVGMSWSSEWQASIVQEARRFGADVIYLPIHARTNKIRFTFTESKWDLFKTAECPILLIRPEATPSHKVVLAAVNFQAYKPHQKELNSKIIETGKWIADNFGADLHVVNGYLDSMHYPDRGKLANESGLPGEKIHVKQGYSSDVVAETAKEINADVVVVGTLGQTGKSRTRRGNTAERVIAGLEVDTVVIN